MESKITVTPKNVCTLITDQAGVLHCNESPGKIVTLALSYIADEQINGYLFRVW